MKHFVLGLALAFVAYPTAFSKTTMPSNVVGFSYLPNTDAALVAAQFPLLDRWFQSYFGWQPDIGPRSFSLGCEPKDRPIFKKDSTAESYAEDWTAYYSKCKSELIINSNSFLLHNVKMLSLKPLENENFVFRRVQFDLPGSTTIKGRLALRPDGQIHPMIIIRMGIFGNSDDVRVERFLMQILFEGTQNHVLILENTTGIDFISHNSYLTAGGFEEGFQNLSVARMIQNNEVPFAKQVSHIHLVGISLGGHGVLHTMAMNEHLKRPLFGKSLVLCPLVDFSAVTSRMAERSLRTTMMDLWLKTRLAALFEKHPDLTEINWDLTKHSLFYRLLEKVNHNFTGPRCIDPRLPWKDLKFSQLQLKDFYKAQNLTDVYRFVKTPVLVLRTIHDHLVSYELNTAPLQQIQKQDNNMGVITFDQGHHCSLPVAYDWNFLRDLFLNYFRE